jgi:hypothetical protein
MLEIRPLTSSEKYLWSLSIKLDNGRLLQIDYQRRPSEKKIAYFEFSKKIENLLTQIYDSDKNCELFNQISDSHLQTTPDINRLIDADKVQIDDEDGLLQIAALYKAIHSFLRRNDRVDQLNAYTLLCFSLWQWLNFLKILIKERNPISDEKITLLTKIKKILQPNKYPTRKWKDFLLNEFASAYKNALTYLQNPELLNKFSGFLRTKQKDFIIYSLVLDKFTDKKSAAVDFRSPVTAAGLNGTKRPDWNSVVLHPAFVYHRPARVAVLRLVTHYALPSYDFDASLNLAHLLLSNKPLKKKNLFWIFIAILTAIITLPIFLINTIKPLAYPFRIIDNLITSLAFVIFFIGFLASIIYLFSNFHRELIIHLLLPRVWAGILVGYSTLIFESSTVNITCALWNTKVLGIPHIGIYVLWGFMLLISTIYLYHDVLPWATDFPETILRTLQTISLTLLLSVLIGLIVLPLSTTAYNNPQEYCDQLLFNYIFGAIDRKQFLVFVPLAYITGLISQFIFEEKPLTTSVWAPIRK